MNHKLSLVLGMFVALVAVSAPSADARADVDVEVAALIGTGVETDSAPNNPYALQLGAVGELTLGNLVLGVRGTRSKGTNSDCTGCRDVKDIRTIGGDVGYAWKIAMLHIGPRLGLGYIKERDGDRVGGYLEPGAVAEAQIALFVVGADLRYRVALGKDTDNLNGFLGYLRLGLRF